ncbi:gastrin-releasing peptide receptor-like [Anneissia japonica]|uniref:gastrin-releasing peptide receptor-like n=1 Tax=Anneissia japonica TaxID=1529436 RepID=UPI00142565B8|nr:gastrin-releasing peptide receptor-like [Anneissia japonica]XP_033122904.1 gastrin-releasing peptide receptor-like [Anneissia japonica]
MDNSTLPFACQHEPIELEEIIRIIIIIVCSVVGIALNGILIIVVLSTDGRGDVSGQFQTVMILSISISDLAYLILTPVHDISMIFYDSVFGSPVVCPMFGFVLVFTQGVSSLSLCLLSFDRYRAIMKPMQHRQWQKKRRYAAATAFIWTLSISMAIPQLFISGYEVEECDEGPDMPYCVHNNHFGNLEKIYTTIQVVVFYLVPVIFITGCYGTIAHKLLQTPQFEKNVSQRKATKQRNKLSMALVIISISFGICWFPIMLNKICMQYIDIFSRFDIMKWIYFVKACPILVYVNCAVDPFIMFTLSRKYCVALTKPFRNWKLLPKRLTLHRRPTYTTETIVLESSSQQIGLNNTERISKI